MQLKNLYNLFAQHSEGQWILRPENAKALYQFIKERSIKKILDLGTGIGCSAAVMALALKDKGENDYHIDSIEQYNKCVTLANQLIPEELKKNIEIYKSKVEIWQTEMIPYQYFMNFKTLPGWDYDLILNDGPAPFEENGHYIELPNGTIHRGLIEENLKPGTFIAWDGRIGALKLLERYFGDNFYLARPSQSFDRDFNVLERKDNPLCYKDERMERMMGAGYFKDLKL